MSSYNDISNLYPKTKIGNKEILDIWNSYNITNEFRKNSISYITYLVEDGDTWSSISQKVYNDRNLWWVIAMMNNVEDPFQLYYDYGVKEKNEELTILNPNYVYDLLVDIKKRSNTITFDSLLE